MILIIHNLIRFGQERWRPRPWQNFREDPCHENTQQKAQIASSTFATWIINSAVDLIRCHRCSTSSSQAAYRISGPWFQLTFRQHFVEPCAISEATASANWNMSIKKITNSISKQYTHACLSTPCCAQINPDVVHSQKSVSHRNNQFRAETGDERFLQRHLHLKSIYTLLHPDAPKHSCPLISVKFHISNFMGSLPILPTSHPHSCWCVH